MADAIHQIVANPQLRRSMQKNSLRLAQENFDIEKHVARLLEIYATLSLSTQEVQVQLG
jgi:glycosyltransferase involved in cell wall biosynthesis